MPQQLTFPFLQQGDECDALAHMLTAKVVNIVQAMAPEGFHWAKGADLEIARVRAAIAEDLRTLLKQAAPTICKDCGVNCADLPSQVCPGCEAYAAHQQ